MPSDKPDEEDTEYSKWYLERYVINPEQLKEKTLKEVAESGKDWAHNSYFRDEQIHYMSTKRAIEKGHMTVDEIVEAFRTGLLEGIKEE